MPRRRSSRTCAATVGAMLGALLLGGGASGAAAQSRDPVITAPLPIAPPGADPVERPAPAHGAPRTDDRDRSPLGAPVFVPPGAVPYYAAPQYPTAPGYTGPAYYAPDTPGAAGPTIGPPGCRQYAPAYDEAGRFLAHVCIR